MGCWRQLRCIGAKARGFVGFSKFGLSAETMKSIEEMGFKVPTPIQEQALPLLLQGEDLIGQAQTGTGKTAAFGICIVERIAQSQSLQRAVRALVLAPTRELAVQIAEEIEKIGKYKNARVLPIYGGQDIERQIRELSLGVDIVVGTPGRLLDHIERRTIGLEQVEVVVLDEADKMLEMGFIEDIEKILDKTPKERQTLLFSATMPEEIIRLSRKYMKAPQEIIMSEETLSVKSIRQYYVETSRFDRLNLLLALLVEKKPKLALIFTKTKRSAEKLNQILLDRGFRSKALHGDMSQRQRDTSMEAFRKSQINVLVATDLASRGLDVEGVTHVINYDTTDNPMTYVHRIGRTGRMGKGGEAISFILFDQPGLVGLIEKATGSKIEPLKIEVRPELLPKRKAGRRKPQAGRFEKQRGAGRRREKPEGQKEQEYGTRGGHRFFGRSR